MNEKELIGRMLDGKATPQEEHLLAQLLRRDNANAVGEWLAEDLTDDYERIVADRGDTPHPTRLTARRPWPRRLAAAAVVAAVVLTGFSVYNHHGDHQLSNSPSTDLLAYNAASNDRAATPLPPKEEVEGGGSKIPAPAEEKSQTTPPTPPLKGRGAATPTIPADEDITPTDEGITPTDEGITLTAESTTAPADSIDYYIARLELAMEQVSESISVERAKQIIQADTRLQQLVNKIYMNELERQQHNDEARYLQY